MNHREALNKIIRICGESSEYSRRTQTIHELAMQALGLTENQRENRHTIAAMRSEKYKEDRESVGVSSAKQMFKNIVKDNPDEFSYESLPTQRTWVK